jgi:hypothetical protein
MASQDVEAQYGVRIDEGSRQALKQWAIENKDKVDARMLQGLGDAHFIDAARTVLAAAAESVRNDWEPPFSQVVSTEATRRALIPKNCPYFC